MLVLLCRHRTDSPGAAHRAAGLLLTLARGVIGNPAAAKAAKASGVLEGGYHFLKSSPAY